MVITNLVGNIMGINVINTNCAGNVWGSTKKALKSFEYLVFDPKYTDELEKGFKTPNQSIFQTCKNAYKTTAEAAGNKNFFQRIWGNLKGIGRDYSRIGRQNAIRASKNLEKPSLWKGLGRNLKPITKRMPLIGNLLFAAMEIPNIFRAFTDKKDGGVGTGVGETVKAATKFGGFAAGAAIGQALIPIPLVGALVGGMIGGWITEKLVGKSFTEKKEEKEEAAAETAQAQAEVQTQAQAGAQVQTQEQIQTPGQTQQNPTQNIAAQNFGGLTGQTNPYLLASNMGNQNPDYMNDDFMSMNLFGNKFNKLALNNK